MKYYFSKILEISFHGAVSKISEELKLDSSSYLPNNRLPRNLLFLVPQHFFNFG